MDALHPLFLLAAIAVGVPLFLHLLHRQEVRRVAFPALRYLERTEREHARRIRVRQLLLLAIRVAAMVAAVGAGAGIFLRGPGSAHPPTAIAIILDNSMSSGLVTGETRTLDRLKRLALRALDDASEGDRIWVILAGEPWLAASPGGPDDARRQIRDARVSAARGDLSAALARASELVTSAPLPAREIHLLSDLQASAFAADADAPASHVPVVVWAPRGDTVRNRAIIALQVRGGLAPIEGERPDVTVATAPEGANDGSTVPLRLLVDGRILSAAAVPPGTSTSLSLPTAAAGWTFGCVESDPDRLSGDDRRCFAFRSRPAPRVAVAGDVGEFTAQAIAVLGNGGRARASTPREADVLVSSSGEALDDARAATTLLVLPPTDATLLPALNRRLVGDGIPWRVDAAEGGGEVPLAGPSLPEPLEGTRVRRWYRLAPTPGAGPSPGPLAMADGDPWAVEGKDASGRRYLLLASPLDPGFTSVPVSPAMVRLMEWVTVVWAGAGSASPDRVAGEALSAPLGADAVRLPSGAELPLDATRMVRATKEAGVYVFLDGDRPLQYVAVNPDPAESDLAPLDLRRLGSAVGALAVTATTEGEWERAVFRARQGPSLERALLFESLLLLLLESAVAATGRTTTRTRAHLAAEGPHGTP